MKYILMILMGATISLSAMAGGPRITSGGGPKITSRPAKVVVVRPAYSYFPRGYGYGYGYSPFYSPFYGYGGFYSPFAVQPHQPTQLDLNIEEINSEFRHDISDVRHDNTLSKAERKQKIRDLRSEKERSIIDAKRDYYKSNNDDVE